MPQPLSFAELALVAELWDARIDLRQVKGLQQEAAAVAADMHNPLETRTTFAKLAASMDERVAQAMQRVANLESALGPLARDPSATP